MDRFLDEGYLLDAFEISGNDIDDFEQILREVDDHTSYIRINLASLKLISLDAAFAGNEDIPDEVEGYLIDPKDTLPGGSLRTVKVNMLPYAKGGHKKLLEEVLNKNRTLLVDASAADMYFMSSNVFNTAAQRIECDGKTLCHQCVERDLLMAHQMDRNLEITLILKHYRDANKVFSWMSKGYGEARLSILTEILEHLVQTDSLGRPKCMGYVVNHKSAIIKVRFEEYADAVSKTYRLKSRMVPFVTLMTSSIGEGSIVAKGGWLTAHGDIVPDTEYVREHRGRVVSETVIKGVSETVFDQFTILPERLMDLMSIRVTPGDADLATASGKARNRETVFETFRWVFRKKKIADILGQSRMEELLRLIDFSTIDEEKVYDAYDIATECFKLPEQLKAFLTEAKLGEVTQNKLREALSKTPYLDFEEYLNSREENTTQLYLTP